MAASPSAAASPQAAAAAIRAGPIVSPEVLADRRVVFRLGAPHATQVEVEGDFESEPGRREALRRGADGIWTLTTAPLAPDYYSYFFVVDGVSLPDPANGELKPGIRAQASAFLVPGPAAAVLTRADVPHGEVRVLWYRSTTTGSWRRLHVYLPPGHATGSRRYPVVYLFHGGGDDDRAWTTIGRADIILDNMIASGAAPPMVLVMPNLWVEPGVPGRPFDVARNVDLFRADLVHDVIPFVERALPVLAGPKHRTMGGLGIGRAMLPQIVWPLMDQAAEMLFVSGGTSTALLATLDRAYPAAAVSRLGPRFFLSDGAGDASLSDSATLAAAMLARGRLVTVARPAGSHGWPTFRRGLIAYLTSAFAAGRSPNR